MVTNIRSLFPSFLAQTLPHGPWIQCLTKHYIDPGLLLNSCLKGLSSGNILKTDFWLPYSPACQPTLWRLEQDPASSDRDNSWIQHSESALPCTGAIVRSLSLSLPPYKGIPTYIWDFKDHFEADHLQTWRWGKARVSYIRSEVTSKSLKIKDSYITYGFRGTSTRLHAQLHEAFEKTHKA